jgi:membrane-associated phospholipid phosphatase
VPRRPLLLLALAGACGLLAAAIHVLAVNVGLVQRADLRVLSGFVGLRGSRTEPVAQAVANAFDPEPYALLCLGVAGIAVLRGKWRYGLAAGVALLGANLTTQFLKATLLSARPSAGGVVVGDSAWPSGHTTAVMSFVLALILVTPSRLRPFVAAVGGLVVATVVYAILLLGWHYPSDVAGGFFVATGWFCLAAAGLKAVERTTGPVPTRRVLWPPVLAGIAATAVVAALFVVKGGRVLDYAREHTTFVAGAALLGAVAVVLSGVIAVAVSAAGRAPRAPAQR